MCGVGRVGGSEKGREPVETFLGLRCLSPSVSLSATNEYFSTKPGRQTEDGPRLHSTSKVRGIREGIDGRTGVGE